MLNQRLGDMKKTLQHELKTNGSAKCMTLQSNGIGSEQTTDNSLEKSSPAVMDDVNFRYLKHVILKFLTSREVTQRTNDKISLAFAIQRIHFHLFGQVEARHLIRAIGTLLNLNAEEEQLLHETLNFKVGWFGTRSHSDIVTRNRQQKLFSIPSPLSS